jgi:hypothetical protein
MRPRDASFCNVDSYGVARWKRFVVALLTELGDQRTYQRGIRDLLDSMQQLLRIN